MPKKKHYKRPKRPHRAVEDGSTTQASVSDLNSESTSPNPAQQPHTEHHITAQYPPVKWFDATTFGSSYTAGGDLQLPKRLPVNDPVLTQTDKSLNKQLWSLYAADILTEAAIAQGPALHSSVADPIQPDSLAPDALSNRLGWHAADQRISGCKCSFSRESL